jgi:hypothetical protein
MKKNCDVNAQELKGRLNARLEHPDEDKPKAALLACGLAAGIVMSAVIAIKVLPLAVLILAILGLGLALRLWGRFCYTPCPI